MSRLTAKRTEEDPYGWLLFSEASTFVFFAWDRDYWPAQLEANDWTIRDVSFETPEDEAAFKADFDLSQQT